MQTPFNPILPANDDGLFIDEVGEWSESKYKLIGNYCNLFTKTMYSKFERLVYIDLFSGCGYSKIRNSTKIIKGSPLIALSLPNNFTDYIFCDEDENKITALKERANKILKNNPQIKSHFIKGKCNLKIDDIIKCMPQYSPQNRVLTFCFVDPYNIEIDFSTISKLSYYKIDFMILLAFGMDAKRNYKYYLEDKNKRIEKLLNNKEWRKIFTDNYIASNSDFVRFIANEFNSNMESLGYLQPEGFQSIRSSIKNLDLYHLAFYSKNPLGNKFWAEIKKYYNPQQSLF